MEQREDVIATRSEDQEDGAITIAIEHSAKVSAFTTAMMHCSRITSVRAITNA